MKALDLSTYIPATWEVILSDKTVINIKKPTQKIIIEMAALQQKLVDVGNHPEKYTAQQAAKLSSEFLLKILNNNKEEKTFKTDYVEKYFDNDLAAMFIQSFSEFAQEIMNSPNS